MPPPPPNAHIILVQGVLLSRHFIFTVAVCLIVQCLDLLILTDYVPESGKNVKSTKYASPYHVCAYGIGVATFLGGVGGGWWGGYESVNAYLYLQFHKTPRMEFVLISQIQWNPL